MAWGFEEPPAATAPAVTPTSSESTAVLPVWPSPPPRDARTAVRCARARMYGVTVVSGFNSFIASGQADAGCSPQQHQVPSLATAAAADRWLQVTKNRIEVSTIDVATAYDNATTAAQYGCLPDSTPCWNLPISWQPAGADLLMTPPVVPQRMAVFDDAALDDTKAKTSTDAAAGSIKLRCAGVVCCSCWRL